MLYRFYKGLNTPQAFLGEWFESDTVPVVPIEWDGVWNEAQQAAWITANTPAPIAPIPNVLISLVKGDNNNIPISFDGQITMSAEKGAKVTGLLSAGASQGLVISIRNVGINSFDFGNNSTKSSANNRFSIGSDMALLPNQSVQFIFTELNRWELK